jgi:hypothetical protein
VGADVRGVADTGVVEAAHKLVASVGLRRNPAAPAEEVVVVDALL